MKDIFILGAGGFAKEVHFLIREVGGYNIVAFVDNVEKSHITIGKKVVPVITDEQLMQLSGRSLAIGIGNPKIINKLSNQFKGKFDFPNLIHPGVVADWEAIELGEGNIICSGVNFTTDIKVGSFNIFNLSCTVGHDTLIGNCNVLNPGANISGGVVLKDNILVGTNATILQYINVDANSTVGASSFVNKHVAENTTVVGVPAKPIEKSTKAKEENKSFEILGLKEAEQWKNYLLALPVSQRDIYYTPEYYKLYETLGDGKTICVVYKENDNLIIYPFLLNSVSKLGYKLKEECYDIEGAYGYNGIISNSKDKAFIQSFYSEFNNYCNKNNIVAEFSRYNPLLRNELLSIDHATVIENRKTVVIDLEKDHEFLWNEQYTSKNRNVIRKARLAGNSIEILSSPSKSQIKKFIEIYQYSMEQADAKKYYFFNSDYFFNIFKYLDKNVFLFNVLNKDGEVACSSIFFLYGDYFHYHLSGRTAEANNSVNNFLIDSAVVFAKKNNAKFLHLGGGRINDENDSLFKFKKSFSKQLNTFYIGKKIYNQPCYNEIIEQWEKNFPGKKEEYNNILFKYRQ